MKRLCRTSSGLNKVRAEKCVAAANTALNQRLLLFLSLLPGGKGASWWGVESRPTSGLSPQAMSLQGLFHPKTQ